MVTSSGFPQYGLAACLACNNPYIVTPTQRNCRLCGQPSDLILAFAGQELVATPEPPSPAEPEAPVAEEVTWGAKCPFCELPLMVTLTSDEAYLSPPAGIENDLEKLRSLREWMALRIQYLEEKAPSPEPALGDTPQDSPAETASAEEPDTMAAAPEPAPAAEPIHTHSYQWRDLCHTWVCAECTYHVNHVKCQCGWEPLSGPP